MLLIGLIILLLGLGSSLLPCLRCVRASSTRAQKKLRVAVASQVENIPVILSEKNKIIPMGVAFSRVQVLESFSVFIGDALRAPNLFSEKIIASKLLNQKRHVGIGTTGPAEALDINGNIRLRNATSNTIFFGNTGVAAPGASSVGEKIQLYGTPSTVNASDYALGIESSYMWFNTGGGFKWYEGSNIKMVMDTAGNVGIGFTCPFFRSSIGTISRATQRTFKNFRTQAKRHRKRAQGGGSPRAAPFLVTV